MKKSDFQSPSPPREGTDPLTVSHPGDGVTYVATYRFIGASAPELTELRVSATGDAPVTVEALRAVPLSELHTIAAKAARLRPGWQEARRGVDEALARMPKRFTSAKDYADLLNLSEALQELGDRQPLKTMAQGSGVPYDTLAARLRKARQNRKREA